MTFFMRIREKKTAREICWHLFFMYSFGNIVWFWKQIDQVIPLLQTFPKHLIDLLNAFYSCDLTATSSPLVWKISAKS